MGRTIHLIVIRLHARDERHRHELKATNGRDGRTGLQPFERKSYSPPHPHD
jgi:hypothetical protein